MDLVAEQIKIAAGEPLIIKKEDIARKGHAIEARIYAEDPVTFFPSPGTITSLKQPEGEGIRHESAAEAGTTVTPFYDPMIAKLVVSGETRQQACERLIEALESYKIEGIKTNIDMLLQTARHENFLKGHTTTKFVEQYYLPLTKTMKK